MRTILDCALAILMTGLLGSSACTFNSNYQDTEYRCDLSQECPSGFACSAGVCRSLAELEAPCGTTEMAAVDFTDFDPDDLPWLEWWWFDDGYDVDGNPYMFAEDGQLVFYVPGDHYDVGVGFGSKTIFPLSGSAASIELVEMPADGTLGMLLSIMDDESRNVAWWVEPDSLYTSYDDGIGYTTLDIIPYDPAVHRWLRVSERDGEFVWETSPDNIEWTVHTTMEVPDFDPWVYVDLEVWKGASTQEGSAIVVDNLNGGTSDMNYCPAATLQDDFDDGTPAVAWDVDGDGNCQIREQDGRLGFAFPDAGSAWCSYRSETFFDLRRSGFTVEAPLEDVSGVEHEMGLYLRRWQEAEFELEDGTLRGESQIDGNRATLFEVEFDPVLHRYWRLRGDDTAMFWEVSSDNRDWQILGSHTDPPLELDLARVELAASTNDGMVDTVGVGYDNLNIAPSEP